MSARATCSCGWTATYGSPARAEAMSAKHACKSAVRRSTRSHRCARCGLEAVYENAGATEARYWFSKHSCRKRELAMLRANQAEQQRALVDRTPKPCLHKVAHHEHGHYATYVLDKCRCEPCSEANRRYKSNRVRQIAYGRWNQRIPAGPVREHVDQLTAAGMGLKRIAQVSGVAHGSLWKLMYGKTQSDGSRTPSRRVLRTTAEKLYAIDPAWNGRLELAPGAKDPDGTPLARKRIQSLVAIGWSMSELGRRLGGGFESPGNACALFNGTSGRVMQRRTVDAANALFEQLCMTPAPQTSKHERISATRARRYARAHGWVPPLELEDLDDEISDDISADVDEVAIQRRMNGDKTVTLSVAERRELCRRWLAQDRPYGDLARVCGIPKPERYYRLSDDQEATA